MALSDNAIGFYLEMENTTFSRTLRKATKDYDQYTKALEKFNARAYTSAEKGLAQIEALVKRVTEMPTATERALAASSTKFAKSLKPITQKVDLAISVNAKSKLRRSVGEAVTEAMTDANVRLTASMPERRLAMFDNAVGLRAQYQQQTQPPDMKGKIRPLKKFAEGGVVEGPPGLDKVFAMLTKGEIVIPAEVSKRLKSVAGKALKTGEFDDKELKKLMKLTRGFDGDLGEVNKTISAIHANLDNLTDVTRARLAGAMLQATKRIEDLADEGEDAGNVFERFFKQILGPAKFLALRAQFNDLREGVNDLRAGTQSAFSTLGGDEIKSGIESLNQMNQFLGLSRDALGDIKVRAGAAADELEGVTFDEFANGLRVSAELGIRNVDTMFDLATAASAAAKGTDIAQESAVKFGFEMTHSLNMSQAGLEATLGTMAQLSDSTSGFNISASKLFSQTEADVEVLNTSLQKLDDTTSQRLLASFNKVGAVLESQFIEQAGDVRQILAKAFEGGPDNVEAIGQAMLLTGLNQDTLRQKLLSGDLEGIFNRIGQQVKGLSPDAIKALSREIGISSADLGRFGDSIGAINEGFAKAETRVVATGEGLEVLRMRALNNRTAWEKLQETITDWAANASLVPDFAHRGAEGLRDLTGGALDFTGALRSMDVSGVEVLDFFKEFNPLSVIAGVSLAGTALKAVKAAGAFFGLGGAAAAGGAELTGVAAVAAKTGPRLLGLAKAAGPIALLGAAVGALALKAVDFHKETVERELAANEEQAKFAHMDPTRLKRNIARLQKQIDIDETAGRVVNPTKVATLERYNQQLAELEGHLKATYGRGQDATVAQAASVTPPTPAEIAALTAEMPMASMEGAENKLDKNNMLMEQLVALMREQVMQGRTRPAANAGPATQGPSRGISPFGQMVAGGEL